MRATARIPLDTRYPNEKRPLITTNMKGAVHGEFTIPIEKECPECEPFNPDPNCSICEGQHEFMLQREIPWNTCKAIYRMMAAVAMSELTVSDGGPEDQS